MVIGLQTMKFVVCTSPQPVLLIVIGPVTAPAGTVAVNCVALLTVNCALTLFASLTDVTSVRFVPLMITVLPVPPRGGRKLVMVGQATDWLTVNVCPATVIVPVRASPVFAATVKFSVPLPLPGEPLLPIACKCKARV